MKLIKSAAILFAAAAIGFAPRAGAQDSQAAQAAQQEQPKRSVPPPSDNPPHMNMDEMGREAKLNPDGAKSANEAMSGHDMEMNGHMYMTALRPKNIDDDIRGQKIVATLQTSIAKYKDYKVALADGFQIFHPEIPQEHYHFTNYSNAFKATFNFDEEHPTSLLYKKTADGYELEGAMYTARKGASEAELNDRVPLSVARWHKHINFCAPPKGTSLQNTDLKTFGLRGSIVTEEACTAAGGRWHAQVFGWMVHVYPYESDPDKIWAH